MIPALVAGSGSCMLRLVLAVANRRTSVKDLRDHPPATLGERFAHALASKDEAELRCILSPDVTFKALTPGRPWEAKGPNEVLDILFAQWFEDSDHIEALVSVEGGLVEDRNRVAYRVLVHNRDGDHMLEQQAYFDVDGDVRISWMNILCSGYRPRSRPSQR